MLSQRELLDQLMGKDRNLIDEDKKVLNQHWYDDNICKYFICGFCPHDLFYNTKSDLGPCTKIHDEHLRQTFEAESESRKASYQSAFLRLLQSLTDDVDRRKRRGSDRLAMQLQPDVNDPGYIERQKQIEVIKDQQVVLIDQIRQLGESGKIDESFAVFTLFDDFEKQKVDIETDHDAGQKFITDHEKKMGVCEICGAFLVQNEAESRIQSHLNGKQHVGFAMIREKIIEVKAILDARAPAAASESNDSRPPPRRRSRSPRRHGSSRSGSDYPRRSRSPPRRSPRRSPHRSSNANRHRESSSRRHSDSHRR
uniref:Uncharacterized protein n=1 Tax=Spongospora subterranea TaxID=70186 RepID=A0A0H5REN6_9EUKA|eukprot:CRZ07059.1 hypothetical protein [Spongospora subterranea]